ncbi:hypothetical protein KF707_11235 [Candidatus Obscuribacterales bacterium]|nr:hypothetical protein [Candidatus Obscuribacterales bacterium]MBX3150516.1 hypothetical protein [Candidatus Obscuribacterales bacterium]
MVQPSQTKDSNHDKPSAKKIEGLIAAVIGSLLLTMVVCAAAYQMIFSLNIGVVPGKATIVNKRIITDDDGASSYTLDYAFEANGHTIRHSASCSEYSYKRLNEGDSVNIDYFSPLPQAASKLDFKDFEFKKP